MPIVAHGFVRLVRRGHRLHCHGGLYPLKDGRFSQVERRCASPEQRFDAHAHPVYLRQLSVMSEDT